MKNKIRAKIILTFLVFGFFVLPGVILAQPAAAPSVAKPSAADNINVELKVPLPFVKTTDGKVQNLKDYIEGVYRLLIGAGAIFAVVMIIIAGYQWMLSGGSSDKTGDAKKRIWNASIGLILALLSYIILNTISARLVELRLPKVDPVPPFYTGAGVFCATDPGIIKLNEQASADQDYFLTEVGGSARIGIKEALCGKRYTVANNAGQCAGHVCLTAGRPDPKKTCVNGQCGSTMMYGNIEWHPANGFVDYIRVYPVCGGDLMDAVGEVDVNEKGGAYSIVNEFRQVQVLKDYKNNRPPVLTLEQQAVFQIRANDCAKQNKLFQGFVLEVEVNNDCYFGLTTDTNFAMGKDKTKPIHQGSVYDPSNIDWNKIEAKDLIPFEDVNNKALQYDLVIDRSVFPIPDLRSWGKELPDNCPVQ